MVGMCGLPHADRVNTARPEVADVCSVVGGGSRVDGNDRNVLHEDNPIADSERAHVLTCFLRSS